MNKFWQLTNSVDSSDSTLILDGPISSESWWGDEVTPQLFRDELKKISSKNLIVSINSTGGDVWAGISIYNALRELDANVTVRVDGLAASIASVIAMAGDKIIMSPGSTMMVHRASMLAIGNAKDLEKAIEMLDTVEEGIIGIYSERTGQTKEAVKQMLEAETWMSPEKAVELGFADEATKIKEADSAPANIFSGNFAFSMSATKESMKSYLSKVANSEEEAIVIEPKVEEVPEVPEVNPEVIEETVEEIKPNEVDKTEETKEMDKELAMATIIEPKDQAIVTPKATVDYLKTDMSMEDFAEVLRANAGKTTKDVKDSWKDMLVKNGLTDPTYFALPEPLITQIEDAVKTSGIYNLLNHTGLDVFKVVWDDTDSNTDTSRAGGHVKADTKDEQVLDFDDRTIRAQYIYKYLVLDKETIRENRSTGALVRFVLNELPIRIIREIERAVVIGDGRIVGNKRHITKFTPIKDDVVAVNDFGATYTPALSESKYESLIKAMDLLEAEGPIYLVAKKGYLTDLMLEVGVNGGYIFAPGTDVARAMGFAGKFEPTWFNDATDPDFDAYLVVFSGYKTVGDNSIESFTNFKLETNENEYLQEIYKGGALSIRKAAVGIVTTDVVS